MLFEALGILYVKTADVCLIWVNSEIVCVLLNVLLYLKNILILSIIMVII